MRKQHMLVWAGVLAAVIAANVPAALAQYHAVFGGKVEVAKTKAPVDGAVIKLAMVGSGKVITMTTDKKGNFSRAGIRPGTYNATVEREGFHPLTVNGLTFNSNDKLQLVLPLEPVQ